MKILVAHCTTKKKIKKIFMLNVRHFKCFAELFNISPHAVETLSDSFGRTDACSKLSHSGL